MQFFKFSSIENTYQKKYLDRVNYFLAQEFQSEQPMFCVTEKVHGSNLSIIKTEDSYKLAKRSGFVEDNEKFYNAREVVASLESNLENLFNFLKEGSSEVTQITIYGEIFGGSYNHPDVERISSAVKVQKGVMYSPDNHFLAFGLRINDKYQPKSEMYNLFTKFEIPFLPILKIGSLESCLEYPNSFQTRVPEMLGLPKIEDNICEGVVIEPYEQAIILPTGSRLILKNKNEKFKEKEKNKDRKPKAPVVYSEEVTKVMEAFSTLITENRLRNVLSKSGEIGPKDYGKISQAFNQDIQEDFLKDDEFEDEIKILNTLEKVDRKQVNKWVSKQANNIISSNFKLIMAEEF